MFTVSTNSFICRFLLRLLFLLLLLPSHLLRHPFAVEADEPIDPTCKTSNEYLDAMYRCRAGEFQAISYCANQPLHELTCNRTNRMAIFNASIGRSSDRSCSQTVFHSSNSGLFHGTTTTGATECCLLSTVENKCHGRTKCNLNAAELLHSTDAELCVSRDNRQTQQRIMIVFICVSHKTFRELKRDRTSPDAFCDGHAEAGDGGGGGDDDDAADGLRRKSVNAVRSEESQMTTTDTPPPPHPVPPTDTSDLTSPDQEFETESTAVYRSAGSLDWIWAIIFIRDNMDRFLIYLFLSIAVGVILVLVVVMVGLCFGRCWKKRRHSKELTAAGAGDHVTQSSTQTNDVTASLMATTGGGGGGGGGGHAHAAGTTEVVHYDDHQTDSAVQRRPVTPIRPNGNSSLAAAGNSVRFAPDNFGQQGVRRTTKNVGPTNLNRPQYQITSGSNDSTEGDDRVDRLADHNYDDNDNDNDYRSNTLGRFYSNPYRHDSYRADEYRTLQHR